MEEKIKFKLQGHEKFTLRDGWLNKGLIAVPGNIDIFLRKDATDLLGIGSNMVKSLRYWMRAFGLTEESPSKGTKLSEMGKRIAKYDQYLEDPFSLWIMHSYIAKNNADATVWYMYFNHCDADELEKEQIERILFREVTKYVKGQTFSPKSLSNDVDVLLSMYSRDKKSFDPEDKNISPFATLGLVRNIDGKYAKVHPDKRIFSEYVVLYELSFLLNGKESISIEDVIFGEKGLYRLYNLSGVMANEILDRLDALGFIRVDRTAGLDMIYPSSNLNPIEIIETYYEKRL